MAAGVDMSKTHKCGDLHHNNDKSMDDLPVYAFLFSEPVEFTLTESEGGAYFTDSVVVAAQFACYKDTYDPSIAQPTTVHVLGEETCSFEFAASEEYHITYRVFVDSRKVSILNDNYSVNHSHSKYHSSKVYEFKDLASVTDVSSLRFDITCLTCSLNSTKDPVQGL